VIVIGLLSGTSADGIDAAAADLSLEGDIVLLRPLGACTTPLPEAAVEALLTALPPGPADARAICVLDTLLGQAFAEAAVEADATLCDGRADLISSHGQTLYHWVEGGDCRGTLQLGQPAWIAEATGRPVVADLRARDVAAGGHGAPLAALLDRLLLGGSPGRRAALNLGGIANISIVGDGVLESAFDTGPANVLIDAAAQLVLGQPFDRDGAGAATGTPHAGLLDALLADPYYALPPPKSTGRERFHRDYLRATLDRLGLVASGAPQGPPEPDARHLEPQDLLATATELTARTVAAALAPAAVEEVVVSGGGARNPTLLDRLRHHLPGCAVRPIDRWGIPADAKEAYLFALLGFLAVCGLPGADPAATGAGHAAILGALTPPSARLPDLPDAPRPPRRLRVIGSA
jgi:anhydro-N-acetylmuramic acid kinase